MKRYLLLLILLPFLLAFRGADYTIPLSHSLNGVHNIGAGTFARTGVANYVNPADNLITEVADGVPRIELVGGRRALLLEPAGTNLLTKSCDLSSDPPWNYNNLAVVSGKSDPMGTNTAFALVPDAVAGPHLIEDDTNGQNGLSGSDTYAFTLFVKASYVDTLRLRMDSWNDAWAGYGYSHGTFDLSAGTCALYHNDQAGAGIDDPSSYMIQEVGNGWYRVGIICTIASDATRARISIFVTNAAGDYWLTGDASTEYVEIWGVDWKKQNYFDSYVHTTSGVVTRNVETLNWTLPSDLFAETLSAEVLDDPTLNAAAEWNDDDGNVTHDDVAGTVTWDGLGFGYFYTVDFPFTVGEYYRFEVTIDSISTGEFSISTIGAFQEVTHTKITTAGTHVQYVKCTDTARLYFSGNAACDAVVSNISFKRVTNAWTDLNGDTGPPRGTLVLYWRPGFAEADAGADNGIVAVADAAGSLIYHDISGNGIASHDGATEAVDALAFTADTWYKLVVQWGELNSNVSQFRIGQDVGSDISWGAWANFDGAYSVGSFLNLAYGMFGPVHYSDIQVFKRIVSDTELNRMGSP